MVLLTAINAKYIHSNLAIYCLKASGKKFAEQVDMAEFTINHNTDHILAGIFERKPDVVAFSCYIWNITQVLYVAENLKKIMPEVSIVMGGPEVSYNAKEVLMQREFVDMVMVGEGEITFQEYLEHLYGDHRELSEIKGIVYRQGREIVENPWRETMDLNDVPFPYPEVPDLENRIVYYETSRGCPFNCSYCLSSIDKRVRLRSLPKVYEEMTYFLDKNVPQVKFVDRTFNCNHDHAYAIWKFVGEHDNGVTNFHFEISADLLRDEDYELFQTFRPGLIQLEIGVQSTNPETITAIHRKMNLEKLKHAVDKVHEKGNIHQHLDLIAGLPYEDYETFGHSFDDVFDMKPDQLQLGFLKVLKGAHMGEVAQDYGIEYGSLPPYEVLATKWLPYEDVLRLKGVEEMVEVYYNSFQFQAAMAYLLTKMDRPFTLFEKLADYYKKKGYFSYSCSRFDRYTILQEFADGYINQEERQIFAQVLTYDLYLRDNVKNPPAFVEVIDKQENRLLYDYMDTHGEDQTFAGYEGLNTKQRLNQMHMRRFDIDMDVLMQKRQIVAKEEYYLFDYKHRSPLNHSAKVTTIPVTSVRGECL